MDQQLKELCIKCEENSNLELCLGKYTKPRLKQILDLYGVKLPSAAKKQEMADRAQDEIKSHVLTYFRGEGAELKDTMQDIIRNGLVVSDSSRLQQIQPLVERGFVFLTSEGEDARVVVPINVRTIMEFVDESRTTAGTEEYPAEERAVKEACTDRTQMEEELIHYAASLANMYGVYPANQLKEVWDFNHQRGVSPNEITRALEKSGDSDGFYISDSYLVVNILKSVEDYVNVLASLKRSDMYYYPPEDVIEEFADGPVYKVAPEYYFLRSYLGRKCGGEEAAEALLQKLFLVCARDAAANEVIGFLKTEGVEFDDLEDLNRFTYLYTCWFYELRIWSCKGYKPSELKPEKLAQRNFVHAEGVNPKKIRLTGRNEECPCGSGKKFKKCCMKYTEE